VLHGEQLVAKNKKDARSVLRENGVRRVCFHRILVTR
jgi:DNA-directed RNA polymerase subunit N (RpoN/RPB10)